MGIEAYLGLDSCNKPVSYAFRLSTYRNVLQQSSNYIVRRGLHLMNPERDFYPSPWFGGYTLDSYLVPKGSVLDITSAVYSMRIDPLVPDSPAMSGDSVMGFAESELEDSFTYGIQADDLYFNPKVNRFLCTVNRNTPFSISYVHRAPDLSAVVVPDDNSNPPPPVTDLNLERYNGTSVLNRNILVQGDLNFHLIVLEEQQLEFTFQSEQQRGPRAEVEVQWCGRLIPKTIFEEVIKSNG